MSQVKLDWQNKTKLQGEDFDKALLIYGLVNGFNSRGVHPTGKMLAAAIETTPQDIRKIIQNIREHNNEFETKKFLVAGNKGYYITDDKKVIRAFIKKTHLMAQHKLQQVEQGYKAMGYKGW